MKNYIVKNVSIYFNPILVVCLKRGELKRGEVKQKELSLIVGSLFSVEEKNLKRSEGRIDVPGKILIQIKVTLKGKKVNLDDGSDKISNKKVIFFQNNIIFSFK